MKHLISCHMKYLLHKTTIMIIFFIILMIMIHNISSSEYLETFTSKHYGNFQYFYNSFMVVKIVGVILMVFLFGNSFLSKNDQYAYLLLTANVSRPMYLFSKIISLMLIVLLFIWFVFFCFVIVGFLSSNQYIFSWEFAQSYIFLFLYYIYYSLFGLIAVQLTQNIYTIMVPIVIVNLGTILNENPKSAVYYNFFFPSFNSNNLELQFGAIHSLIAIVILCFINLFLYWQKDL